MVRKQSASDVKKVQEAEAFYAKREKARDTRVLAYSLLNEYEPMVMDVLNRTLVKQQLANAYLFTGNTNALKEHAAMLLAQTILLNKDELIDEQHLSDPDREAAMRIAEHNHMDLMVLKGDAKTSITLDQVIEVSSHFSKTSTAGSGRRVYIIYGAEYMTVGAMNGLLKFLEEPGEGVYAILTTDQPERILPTVLSRCVSIPFHALESGVYEEIALHDGCDPEDAYLLSFVLTQMDGYVDYSVSTPWQMAKVMFRQWLNIDADRRMLFTDYEYGLKRIKDNPAKTRKDDKKEMKDATLDMLYAFFSMAMQYEKDAMLRSMRGPSWYINAVLNNTDSDQMKIQKYKIALEARDKVNRTNDLSLVLAQAVSRWESL